MTNPSRGPLLSLRAALIVLFAILSGVGAGVLAALAGQPPAGAALIGIGTTAAAIRFFDWLIT